MAKKHLKRLAMPKTWPLARKSSKRVTRPMPGAHSFQTGMPLNHIMKDMLGYAETTKDVKNMLKNKDIIIEGKTARSYKQIIGLMDVVEIPKTGEAFRVIIGKKGKLGLVKAKDDEKKVKLCKIIGKKMHKGKVQIITHDGRTIITDNKEYRTGDSLLISFPKQEIRQHIKMEKNTTAYMTGGSHIGEIGKVESIEKDKIVIAAKGGRFETLKKFAFAAGKEKPAISIEQ